MGQKRLHGVQTETRLVVELSELPMNHLAVLKEAVDVGTLNMSTFWRKRKLFHERELDVWKHSFEQVACGNAALAHLQMACFLMQLCSDTFHRKFQRTQIDRYFLVCAIIQHELTLACLTLSDQDLRSIPGWWESIGLGKKIWISSFKGANSVARVAYLLMQKGFKTYIPTATIDSCWKINLIAHCPKTKYGMCIRIKTTRKKQHLEYQLFDALHASEREWLSEKDERFREGVAQFRSQNHGTWFSIKLGISNLSYATGAITPCESMQDAASEMILDICTTPQLSL